MALELQILDYLQTIHTPLLDKLLIGASTLGNTGIVWIGLTLILLIIPKTRSVGKVLVLALIIELVTVNLILKPVVHRPRPFEVNPAVQLLVKPPVDYSFPSGHTSMAFTVVLHPGDSHRIFQDVSLCTFPHRCAGRTYHRFAFRLCRL